MSPSVSQSVSEHDEVRDVVEEIAEHADAYELSIACAESLTAGAIASALARGTDAASWFAGGVVSYMSEVKFEVLGVTEGPVITARCAEEMVRGVRALLGTDAAVAVTGVGGPDEEEGEPSGTVFIASLVADGAGRGGEQVEVTRHLFEGDPPAVLDQTVAAALRQLRDGLAVAAVRAGVTPPTTTATATTGS